MDFEGTILTEGMGVGRGTRFATPESNRRLDIGGRERGIEGGKGGINPGAAINIDAGNAMVRARSLEPLQTKPVITDGKGISARAMSNVGEILSRAAFDYADRQAENEATVATLGFNERARVAFYGDSENPDSKGLAGLEGAAAVSARADYFGAVDKDYAETIASLSPAAKQKAMARLGGIRDTALNRGASHIAQEQHNYDLQLRASEVEDMARELPLDYQNAPNLKIALLSKFGQDTINGNKAWDSVAIEGGNRLYLDAYKRSLADYKRSKDPDKPEPTGIPSLLSYRESVAPEMSTKALNDLDDLIKSFEVHEVSAQKAAQQQARIDRKEAREALVVEAMAYEEQHPGALSSIQGIAGSKFKGLLVDPQDTKAVLGHSEHKREVAEKGQKQENTAGLNSALIMLRDKGVVFEDKLSFNEYAHRFNVYTGLDSLYNDHRASLSHDEKMVQDKYKEIMKSAYSAFMWDDDAGSALPQKTGNASIDAALILKSLTGGSAKKHEKPKELETIENALFQIQTDSKLLPYEKSERMTKYIQEEAVKAGVPKDKVESINPIPIIAQQFLVKSNYAKMTNGDQVMQDRLGLTSPLVGPDQPAMLPTSEAGLSLPSTQIIEPIGRAESSYIQQTFKSAGTVDDATAIVKAAQKSGYKSVRFVVDENGEMFNAPGTRYTGYVGINKNGDTVRINPKIGKGL